MTMKTTPPITIPAIPPGESLLDPFEERVLFEPPEVVGEDPAGVVFKIASAGAQYALNMLLAVAISDVSPVQPFVMQADNN